MRLHFVALTLALNGAAHAEATFPIKITHAFGTTVITEKPERIATVNFGNQEVPLALGVVPVGMAATNFGDDDDDGVLPWNTARLEELGAEVPVLFDEGDGIDFEAVAATEPDVILAAHSGMSLSDYETLSKIAPTVAYPDGPWTTDWRSMIRMNSAGMAMPDEGEALIASLEAEIAEAVARHPDIAGKTAIFVTHLDPTDLSMINFYTANDTRVQFFKDLGLAQPKAVVEASLPGKFAASVSAEKLDVFADVDIVVTYGSQPLFDAMKVNQLVSKMPAVSKEAVVLLPNGPTGHGANPTPLSIGWLLEGYLTQLSEAAAKSE